MLTMYQAMNKYQMACKRLADRIVKWQDDNVWLLKTGVCSSLVTAAVDAGYILLVIYFYYIFRTCRTATPKIRGGSEPALDVKSISGFFKDIVGI
jgi:hypothetical protein